MGPASITVALLLKRGYDARKHTTIRDWKMLNKDQRDGLARLFDTLTASAVIGLVVGSTGHTDLTWREILALCLICPLLLSFSLLLRRTK